MDKPNVSYQDGRDSTNVFSGLKLIGVIERGEGGWAYRGKNQTRVTMSAMPSRHHVKKALRFSKRGATSEGEEKLTVDVCDV